MQSSVTKSNYLRHYSEKRHNRGEMTHAEFKKRFLPLHQFLYREAYRMLGEKFEAEDAVQDTFLKAYKRLDDLRDAGRERAWLMSIAINTCRDYLRTAWLRHTDRRVTLDLLPEPTCESIWPDTTVITEVMRLPQKLREAVLLRYYQGMKLSEAAEVLHISTSTVKQRLDRANTILRGRLERWYFNED